MNLTVLYPSIQFRAIEERYAQWQNELLINRMTAGARVLHYDPQVEARSILADVDSELVLVISDPLLLAGQGLIELLSSELHSNDCDAAVPTSNETEQQQQRATPPEPYLTLRQFEDSSAFFQQSGADPLRLVWDRTDPGLFLGKTAAIRASDHPLARALEGRPVAIVRKAYVHRFASHRGQFRQDLLELVDRGARSILEFGCGEGLLGAALKKRQQARVVGVELDEAAAREARTRLDAVHVGDVTKIIEGLDETFDWVIGGDILEHLDEPWTFLTALKRVTAPGGRLLLSLPNVGNWAVVSDLLRGRFDYVYMGIVCAGHVRFFTPATIRDMLAIAGWSTESISPQPLVITSEFDTFVAKLKAAGVEASYDDLATPGYYVIAGNPEAINNG